MSLPDKGNTASVANAVQSPALLLSMKPLSPPPLKSLSSLHLLSCCYIARLLSQHVAKDTLKLIRSRKAAGERESETAKQQKGEQAREQESERAREREQGTAARKP